MMNVGIVGCGIFGLAAAIELRVRGHQVEVFEQGRVPNERASSTDVSKTIRRLYGDNAVYVELAERAGAAWRAWNQRLGREIYFQIGQLSIQHGLVEGMRNHASVRFFEKRGDPVQLLSVAQARERFPQFVYNDDDTCIFDSWAGYVASAEAVRDLSRLARDDGVVIREGTPVSEVVDGSTGASLVVGGLTRQFDRVVVAAGVWLTRLLPDLGWSIRPTFQQMVFFEPADPDLFRPGRMPVWSVNVADEGWYGHPLKTEGWLKVSNDLPGDVVDPDAERQVTPAFLDAARTFVASRIPALGSARIAGSRACLYENSPDRDLVVDWAPSDHHVLVAGGGSGHGFKFGGSIGELIADALEERPNRLGDFLRIGQRFG